MSRHWRASSGPHVACQILQMLGTPHGPHDTLLNHWRAVSVPHVACQILQMLGTAHGPHDTLLTHCAAVLQGVYRSFVQNAKFVNASSVPHIHFMASCVVEMFGLDMAASYQQAFTAIRQLAVLLQRCPGHAPPRTPSGKCTAGRLSTAWSCGPSSWLHMLTNRSVVLPCFQSTCRVWAVRLLAAHADKQVSDVAMFQ